ncbi:MAG: hypothetical protein SFY56_08695 [Bacteroidota bacterium]|nr:hypothetical protein [Bacteroidota bacterium]
MKQIINCIIILVVLTTFISCESREYFSVKVVEKTTDVPIDSVLVKVRVKSGKKEKSNYNIQGYTDSAGNFNASEMIGYGLSLRRWDFYMDYQKEGYAFKTEVNKTKGVVTLDK